RQLGMAAMRGARSQPHPLDSDPRRHQCRESTHRDAHRSHPTPQPARTPREPLRPIDVAHAKQLALGSPVRHSARRAPRPATRHRLTPAARARPPPPPPRALKTTHRTNTASTRPATTSTITPTLNAPTTQTD